MHVYKTPLISSDVAIKNCKNYQEIYLIFHMIFSGVSRLMDLLSDSREIIRNEVKTRY